MNPPDFRLKTEKSHLMEIKYLIEFAFLKVATSDGAVVAARVEFGRIAGGKLET